MGKSSWKYYGVKQIYQSRIIGNPIEERIDENYSDYYVFFEESIILVKAQSFEHAYRIARSRANEDKYINMYGQTVECKLVDAIDCFLIDEEPKTGVEIYSSITPVSKGVSAKEYLEQKYEYKLDDYEENWRRSQQQIIKQKVLCYEQFSKWRAEKYNKS